MICRHFLHSSEILEVCSQAINLFRVISTYLSPILPQTSAKVAAFLNLENLNWFDISTPLLDHAINKFKPLMTRIEQDKVDAMVEASKEDVAAELGKKPEKKNKKDELWLNP